MSPASRRSAVFRRHTSSFAVGRRGNERVGTIVGIGVLFENFSPYNQLLTIDYRNRGRFPGTQLHKKNAAVASFSHIKHLRERQPRESSPLALLPGNLPRLPIIDSLNRTKSPSTLVYNCPK
jgi:hypothetical protein